MTAWAASIMNSVRARPMRSESTPATMRPAALPTAMIATARKAISPRLFFAMPATLPMTMRPAPEPMKKSVQSR